MILMKQTRTLTCEFILNKVHNMCKSALIFGIQCLFLFFFLGGEGMGKGVGGVFLFRAKKYLCYFVIIYLFIYFLF